MIKTTLHTKFNLNEPTRNGTVYTKGCFNENSLGKEVPVFTDYELNKQIGTGKIVNITDDYFETEVVVNNDELDSLSKYSNCCPMFHVKLEMDLDEDFNSDVTFVNDAELKSLFFDKDPSFKTSKYTITENINKCPCENASFDGYCYTNCCNK